jgi:hypothetical protein
MADETSSSTPEALPDSPGEAFPSESSELHAEPVPVGVLGDTKPTDGNNPMDVVETHQPLDGDHFLAFAISTEVPLNLDHAFDQLTTATDLFDVPVLDYHTPSSDV